jgi:hypothetical protein
MKYYKISEKQLLELVNRDNFLLLLENYGVDNWEGYGAWDESEEISNEESLNYIKDNFEEII